MIELNSDYWDCECEDNYIHHISKTDCKDCGAISDEQPFSRQNEVIYMLTEGFEDEKY